MIIPNFGPLPKLFLSSPTKLHPLSDFLYSPTLPILRYGHGWSLSLFPHVTSLTIGLVGLYYMGCDSWFDWWFVICGSLIFFTLSPISGSSLCVWVCFWWNRIMVLCFQLFLSSSLLHNIHLWFYLWVLWVLCFNFGGCVLILWFGGLGGLCCDLILAGFRPSWWLWFDFRWVSIVVVVVWIWFWLGFGSGAWLEVMSLKSSGHGGLEGELSLRGRARRDEKGFRPRIWKGLDLGLNQRGLVVLIFKGGAWWSAMEHRFESWRLERGRRF